MKLKKRTYWIIGAVSVLLVCASVFGIFFTVSSFNLLKRKLIEEHDVHHLDLAYSIDMNLNTTLHGIAKGLETFCTGTGIREAEQKWHETGDITVFEERLTDNTLLTGQTADILIVRDGEHIKRGLCRRADNSFGAGRAPSLNKRTQC